MNIKGWTEWTNWVVIIGKLRIPGFNNIGLIFRGDRTPVLKT